MRMRKKKNLIPRMERCSDYLIQDGFGLRGRWRETLMPAASELRVELGCGKGRFTVETARLEPDVLFIAIEKVPDAMVMAMERAAALELKNVFFVVGDAALLDSYFAPEEADRIYINFCDPWPPKRQAKRRLTHRGFLALYRKALKMGGQIHFKTDNVPLFEFSLEEFPQAGYTLQQVTRNLHGSITMRPSSTTRAWRSTAAWELWFPGRPRRRLRKKNNINLRLRSKSSWPNYSKPPRYKACTGAADSISSRPNQAVAFFAISTSWVKAASLFTASSESILRSMTTPAFFRPWTKVE